MRTLLILLISSLLFSGIANATMLCCIEKSSPGSDSESCHSQSAQHESVSDTDTAQLVEIQQDDSQQPYSCHCDACVRAQISASIPKFITKIYVESIDLYRLKVVSNFLATPYIPPKHIS